MILVFKTALDTKDKANRAQAAARLEQEYQSLFGSLERCGMSATSRSGGHKAGTILIFVKASEDRLRLESQQELESDFLFDVSSASTQSRDFSTQPISPAERCRLVYHILTSHTTDPSLPSCGLALPCAEFPHLQLIFPPHSPSFNHDWLQSWTHSPRSIKSLLGAIPPGSLDKVKDVMGEKIALYFAFLR